jgi:ATP:ADP antiporter, AAA family
VTKPGPGRSVPPLPGRAGNGAKAGGVGVLRVMPHELPLVVLFGALMLANAFAMQISYVSSVSGFLKADGLNVIWIVWLIDYVIFLAVAGAQTLVIDRFSRVTLMRIVLVAFAIAFAALWTLLQLQAPSWLVYGSLYLVAEQQWLLFPLLYWILANDAMNVSQAKRLFPLLAGFGLAGKLLGLTLAASAPTLLQRWGLDLGHLLLLNGATYLAAIAVLAALRRRVHVRPVARETVGPRTMFAEGLQFIRDVPSYKFLTAALLALMVSDTIVEFRFLAVTDAAFGSQESYQTFYGLYRMVAVALALLVQVFVTNRLLTRVPLKRVLSVQPYVAIAGVIALVALPGILTAVGALLLLRLVGETFHDSAKKTFQGFVPEERRGRVSLVMESYVIAVGTIAGALLIGTITIASGAGALFDPAPVYLAFALVAAVVAALASWKMAAAYDASLLNWRLKRRQRSAASVLDKLL